MKGIALVRGARTGVIAGLPVGHCSTSGDVRSAAMAVPDNGSLHAHLVEMAAGSSIVWNGPHGEDALYVESGCVEVADQRCPAGGAVVVEQDAVPSVTAVRPTRAALMGRVGGEPGRRGSTVHVVGPGGTFRAGDQEREIVIFADSSCPTCSLMLFSSAKRGGHVQEPHSHSQDEVILVLEGSLVMGAYTVESGDSVAVCADQRYGFRAGDGGYRFLNYRPALATMTNRDGSVRPEGGAVNGLPETGDKVDIEAGPGSSGASRRHPAEAPGAAG